MKIIQSNLLKKFKNITHGYTTKKIGNLAYHVNDNPLSVDVNHKNLANEFLYDINSLIYMKQIHSNDVHIIDDDCFNKPPTCDAMVTDKKNTPLMVMVADCSPILFYNENKKVIAVAHAGRQGAFKNIVKNTIETMENKFNCLSKDIYVCIGANIKKCCYEVGIEIYNEAKKLQMQYAINIVDNKYFLDIDEILLNQLRGCGIKKQNIEVLKECTSCNSDKYFSYRVKRETGRFAGIIMLK